MIKWQQIPPEVFEAYLDTYELGLEEQMAAAINAWPGMSRCRYEGEKNWSFLSLPLPQEKNDD